MSITLDKNNLKVLRLDNGEIIFSKVLVNEENSGYLELHWPMKVLVKFDEDDKSAHVALLKWLPFTDTTSVPLAAKCIMSVSELGENYKDFYLSTIKESVDDSKQQELNKMHQILADFKPSGLAN